MGGLHPRFVVDLVPAPDYRDRLVVAQYISPHMGNAYLNVDSHVLAPRRRLWKYALMPCHLRVCFFASMLGRNSESSSNP